MCGTTRKRRVIREQLASGESPAYWNGPSPDLPEHFTSTRYLELIAAVIRSGLEKEGLGYLRTPGGQYWCHIGNLDLEAVQKQAAQRAGQTGANAGAARTRMNS